MNQLITPALSDQIIDFLIDKIQLGDYEEFKSHDFPLSDTLSVDAIDAVLDDLKQKGLIEILTRGHTGYDYTYEIAINKSTLDFQRLGGFRGQELMLRKNLELILAELDTFSEVPSEKLDIIRQLVQEIKDYLVTLK